MKTKTRNDRGRRGDVGIAPHEYLRNVYSNNFRGF